MISFTACLILSILSLAHNCDAIKCWVCNSEHDPACGDPFDNQTFPITDCSQLQRIYSVPPVMCKKIIIKTQDGRDLITRECAHGKDLQQELSPEFAFPMHEILCGSVPSKKYSLCLCGTDGCNSHSMSAPHSNSSPKSTTFYWLVNLTLAFVTVYLYH